MYIPKIKYTKSYIEVYDRDEICKKVIVKDIFYKEDYMYEIFSRDVQKVKFIDRETKNMNKTRYLKYKLKHFFNTILWDLFYFVIIMIPLFILIRIIKGGK